MPFASLVNYLENYTKYPNGLLEIVPEAKDPSRVSFLVMPFHNPGNAATYFHTYMKTTILRSPLKKDTHISEQTAY